MAAIVIRNMDDRVHTALKRQAKAHGRSAEAEARRILEEGLAGGMSARSAAEVFAEVRKALGGGVAIETERKEEPVEPADFS